MHWEATEVLHSILLQLKDLTKFFPSHSAMEEKYSKSLSCAEKEILSILNPFDFILTQGTMRQKVPWSEPGRFLFYCGSKVCSGQGPSLPITTNFPKTDHNKKNIHS